MPGLAPLAGIHTYPLRKEMTGEAVRYLPACSHTEVASAQPNRTNGVFRGTSPSPPGHVCRKPVFSSFSNNVNSQETKDCVFW